MKAYQTAYPGSMMESADGAYVRRDDPESLAAALLECVRREQERSDNLTGALDDAAVELENAAWEDGVLVNPRAEDSAKDARNALRDWGQA